MGRDGDSMRKVTNGVERDCDSVVMVLEGMAKA